MSYRYITTFIILFYSSVHITDSKLKDSEEFISAVRILNITRDIVIDATHYIQRLEWFKQENYDNAPFEVGFMICLIREKYRKMIDRYNISMALEHRLFTVELLMYLEEVEHIYYELEHFVSQAFQLQPLQNTILNELSWPLKAKLLSHSTEKSPSRRVGIEALLIGRQVEEMHETTLKTSEDDTDMRIKLFRLMYETVRDSDLKVKRAELIKGHYANSSVFELGYLMGDVTDKFNIMSDISMTLVRLYEEWRPIEHINAYEQIANKAIEVNHLIEMMKTVSTKDSEKSIGFF